MALDPAGILTGWEGVKAIAVVPPTATAVLAPEASPGALAVSVYFPALLMLQPVKVATPATAATVFALQASEVPAVALVSARVTEAVLSAPEETGLPPASSTETTGWTANAVADAAEVLGSVVNPRRAAEPTLTSTLELNATVSVPSLAVSV